MGDCAKEEVMDCLIGHHGMKLMRSFIAMLSVQPSENQSILVQKYAIVLLAELSALVVVVDNNGIGWSLYGDEMDKNQFVDGVNQFKSKWIALENNQYHGF